MLGKGASQPKDINKLTVNNTVYRIKISKTEPVTLAARHFDVGILKCDWIFKKDSRNTPLLISVTVGTRTALQM